jgi:periplasmic protein TonB
MLDELLESKAGRERRGGGTVISVAAHAAVVILAVVATGRAMPGPTPEKPPEIVTWVAPPERPPRHPLPTLPRERGTADGDPRPAPTQPPIDLVLPGIPPVDVDLRRTEHFDDPTGGPASDRGGAGEATGGETGAALPSQVDRVALLLPGSPSPRYPESLRHSGVEGEVVAQFVVDSTGRVDSRYVAILRADHELFARAVRDALGGMRFAPAEAGGRKVAQLVQLPFTFSLDR